jgi:hypothetical protein
MHEIDQVPDHLTSWWTPELWCIHSADWWKRHWERAGILQINQADVLQDGWKWWLAWQKIVAPDNKIEIDALSHDAGRTLGYVRVVANKKHGIPTEEPLLVIPTEYSHHPLLWDQ